MPNSFKDLFIAGCGGFIALACAIDHLKNNPAGCLIMAVLTGLLFASGWCVFVFMVRELDALLKKYSGRLILFPKKGQTAL